MSKEEEQALVEVGKEIGEALGKMYTGAMVKGMVVGGIAVMVGVIAGWLTEDVKWTDVKNSIKKKFTRKGRAA